MATDTVLVTGAGGFVGVHLLTELGERAVPSVVDVTEAAEIASAVREAQPGAVVHLAAQSSVAASWEDPIDAWNVNVLGTVAVLEAVREEAPGARVLFPSTGEVYGRAEIVPTPESVSMIRGVKRVSLFLASLLASNQ